MTALPTLRQLRVFLAIARFRSFSRAAQSLGLSQSALSQALMQMEFLLGASLVQRNRRSLVLTSAGEVFRRRADLVLAELGAAVDEVRATSDEQHGGVTVDCISSTLLRVLPPIVAEFEKRFPRSTIHIGEHEAARIPERLKTGEADIAVSALFEHDPTIQFVPLLEDRFRLVCRPDHPLAKRAQVTWAELEEFGHVGMAHWTGVGQLIDRQLPKHRARVVYEVSRIPTLLELVSESDLIAVVPALALAHGGIAARLHHCALVDPVIRRSVGLMTSRERPLTPSAVRFRDLALDLVATSSLPTYPDISLRIPSGTPARSGPPKAAPSRRRTGKLPR